MVSLIAFNLTLERISLLDDLKKNVQSLALAHRNYAERELREYHGLLAPWPTASSWRRPGDLVRHRQSYDPALVEGRILGPCAAAPGTGCPSAAAGTPGGPMPGLLMDAYPVPDGEQDFDRPPLDPAVDPAGAEFRIGPADI